MVRHRAGCNKYGDSTQMLTDSRLHVNVRPPLEYKIPEMYLSARDYILGGKSEKDLVVTWEQCLLKGTKVETRLLNNDSDAVAELRRTITRVCTDVDEYLRRLSAAWRAYVDAIWAMVRQGTRKLQRDANNAARMLGDPSREREYGRELMRIKDQLDLLLREAEMRPTPTVCRPEELLESSRKLQDMFVQTYGHVPTEHLIALKQEFEDRIANIEHRIATRLVAKLRTYVAAEEVTRESGS